jgi:perosamine synthetase
MTDPRSDAPDAVSFDWPVIGPEQEAAVLAALRERDLSLPHGVTARFETAVGAFLEVPHVVAHHNGTAAMLSALYAAGVSAGTEVVCPAYTWWASAAPALWLGGTPVFCDIEPENLTADTDDLLSRITGRTRAVVLPHLWGAAADVETVTSALAGRGITVVEDASHVFGTTAHGEFLGASADIGVFSLQMQKALPAGEGGLLVTASDELRQRALAVGHYERLTNRPEHRAYLGTGLGLKARISPLNAALALSYLPSLPKVLAWQETLSAVLVQALTRETGPSVRWAGMQPHVQHGGRTALRLVADGPALADVPVERIVSALRGAGLPAKQEYFTPLHRAPLFGGGSQRNGTPPLKVTDRLVPRLVHIPVPVAGSVAAVRALGQTAGAALARLTPRSRVVTS